MTERRPGVVTPDLAGLRALSHPTRLRILSHLRIEGPATATMLATRFGLNSGATSYHLRQLAEHGFVVDDAQRGNARERWWRAAHQETHSRAADARTPEERDVADAFLQAAAVMYAQNLQAAMEERPLLPKEWRAASTVSDWVHTIPASRAAELTAQIKELIASCPDEPGEDAVPFAVQIQAFPVPGHVAPREE